MGIQLCQPLLLRPSLVLDLRLLSGKISLFDIGLNQLKPSKDGSTSGLHPDNKDSKELNPNGLSPLNFSSDSSAIGLDGDTDDSVDFDIGLRQINNPPEGPQTDFNLNVSPITAQQEHSIIINPPTDDDAMNYGLPHLHSPKPPDYHINLRHLQPSQESSSDYGSTSVATGNRLPQQPLISSPSEFKMSVRNLQPNQEDSDEFELGLSPVNPTGNEDSDGLDDDTEDSKHYEMAF